MLKSELIRRRRLEVLGGDRSCPRELWQTPDGWVANGHVAVRPAMVRELGELEVRGPTVSSVIGLGDFEEYGRLAELTGDAHWTPPRLETTPRRRWLADEYVQVKLRTLDRPFADVWVRSSYLELLWPWASADAEWRVGGGEMSPVVLVKVSRAVTHRGAETLYRTAVAVVQPCRGPR